MSNSKSLFFQATNNNGNNIIFNKREVVSVFNHGDGMMYSHVKMTSGEELTVRCDFKELANQLSEVQHDNSFQG